MLTRRSRREGIASPSDAETSSKDKRSATPPKRSATPSSKRSATPSSKRSATPSSKRSATKSKRSTTPSSKRLATPSKRSATPSKTKKPVARRSKSKSVERRVRTRSRSANKILNGPRVVLERYRPKTEDMILKINELKNKKAFALVDSNSRKSPTPVKEVNSLISPATHNINDHISVASSSTKSDYNEESDYELELNNKTSKSHPAKFEGSFGNIILTALLPILVILSKIAIKTKGKLIPFPRGYLRLANYYDKNVFRWTAAIVLVQFLISCVPLAKKSKSLSRLTLGDEFKFIYYRFSGFINLIIAALIIWAMNYYEYSINFILEIMINKTVPHIVASVFYTFIISIILFIKAKYINQIDNSSLNIFQKLFVGTTINPTLGPINLKLAFYRYSILMTILLNYLAIMDSLKNPVNIHLYFVAGLQIFYAIDKLIFEFNLLSSFYLQNEKFGYCTIIQQFLQPIINFLPIQILLANNLPVNYIILSISSFIFLFGYIYQRYSDFIKYQYERNLAFVYKPSYVRVIEHGLWSYVRYPDYIGTILVHLALMLPIFEPNLGSLQTSWPVLFYPLYYIITLSYQCVRISTYYRFHYGKNWDREYTTKWNLVPKIF